VNAHKERKGRKQVMNNITMEELGRKLRLSRQTISRVVNNDPNVKPETRQRVQWAVSRYSYRPNLLARSMAQNKRNAIGIVMPRGGEMLFNPYFSMIIAGIGIEARQRELTPVFYFSKENFGPRYRLFEMIKDGRVDGGLVIEEENIDKPTLSRIEKDDYPLIILNARLPRRKINWICADDEGGTYRAVKHLIRLGHQRIVYLRGLDNSHTSDERLKGYCKALQDKGISYNKSLVAKSEFLSKVAYQKTLEYINSKIKFTAVCAGNDLAAFGAINALQEKGLRVPEDIAVVGYNDFDFAAMVSPAITTVRHPLVDMGKLGVAKLLEVIENKRENKKSKKVQQVLKTELIIRESCGGKIYRA